MPDAKKRILFLHPSAELTGDSRPLVELAQKLGSEGWESIFVLPRQGPLAAALEGPGARVEIGPVGVLRRTRGLRDLARLGVEIARAAVFTWRLARRLRPDVVQTNGRRVVGGALGAKLSGAPHVWHVLDTPERPSRIPAFARLFDALADRVVCNYYATARPFVDARPRLRARAQVVWEGTAAPMPMSREKARCELGLDPHKPCVVLVGDVEGWKGQELLVRAARLMRPSHPDAHYILVGETRPGEEHLARELKAAIREAGLGDAVELRPLRRDLSTLYAAADVVVVPHGLPEPLGQGTIDAAALARPVVAAADGGSAETVLYGETGLLFDPGDPADLAEALGRLLGNLDEARRMGRAARLRQLEDFTLQRYYARLEAVYRELVEDATSTRPRLAIPAAARQLAELTPADEPTRGVLPSAAPPVEASDGERAKRA